MMPKPELIAIQLTVAGLGLVLSVLIVERLFDLRNKRELGPSERPMRKIDERALLWISAGVAATSLTTTVGPLIDGAVGYFFAPSRTLAVITLAIFAALEVFLIHQLAYDRPHKWTWCGQWILLAHVGVWGQMWVGMA